MASTVASTPQEAAEAKANYLFEVIVRDAQSAATQIGSVTTLLSRHAHSGETALATLRHYFNDDSRVSHLALRYARDAGLTGDMAKALQALYDSVAAAQGELARLTKAATKPEALGASAMHWRRIAVSARDCLRLLQEPTARRLDGVFAQDAKVLQAFLQEAADGGHTRFDALGAFQPPALRQRRQSARLDLKLPCEIVYGGGVAGGEIMNISATGMGLRCQAGIAAGQEIGVRLPDGRTLAAKVQHCERGVIGALHKKMLTDAEILALSKPRA